MKEPRIEFETRGYFDRTEPFNYELLIPMIWLVFLVGVIILTN